MTRSTETVGLEEDARETATTGSTDPGADQPSPRRAIDWTPWREAAKLLLVTRVIFLVVASAASHFLANEGSAPSFTTLWSQWDARLFLMVAEHGYTDPATDPHATAFFPLFPLLLRALAATGIGYVTAGLLISAAASLVAFAYLYRWADEELGAGAGRRAVLYLAFFPTAVFLVAPYSEALFLAGAVPAFYYARRGRWHLVAVPAAVATASRFAGVFLLAGIFVELVRKKDFSMRQAANAAPAFIAGVVPLVAYGLYLARAKGSFFYYFTDQFEGWGRRFVGPVESFLNTWNTFDAGYPVNWILVWRVEIIAALAAVGFVVWAAAKREWGYATYMGIFTTVLITSSWYFSIPRMMLSYFPIMLLLAGYTKTRERHELVLVTTASLAIMGLIVYGRTAWFF